MDLSSLRSKPGEVRSYELAYTGKGLSDLRPLLGQPDAVPTPGLLHTFRVEANGRLYIRVESVRGLRLWMEATRLEIEADGQRDPAVERDVRDGLRKGAVVGFTRWGTLETTRTPKDVHRIAIGLWQVLATRLQWTRPPGRLSEWTAHEPDPNGTLAVQYRFDGKELHRQIRAIEPPEESGAETATAAGSSIFKLEASSELPICLAAEDQVDLLRSGKPIAASHNRATLTLSGDDARAVAAKVAAFEAAFPKALYAATHAEGRVTAPGVRADLERGRLAGRKPSDVWAQFDRESVSPGGAKEGFLLLKALLYLQPGQVWEAERRLRSEPASDSRTVGIAEALADAGHTEAQKALRRAASGADPKKLMILFGAMGGLSAPEPETIADLKAGGLREGPEADTALLALGRLAHPKGKSAGHDAGPIVQWLIARFESASMRNRRTVLCLALGNTGSPLADTTIRVACDSEDADLRGAAATALRWMPAPLADARLRGLLASDLDPEVRRRAAGALAFRQNATNLYGLTLALRDRAPAVRLAALAALAQWSPRTEEIRKGFEMARNDPDPDVRKFAESLGEGGP